MNLLFLLGMRHTTIKIHINIIYIPPIVISVTYANPISVDNLLRIHDNTEQSIPFDMLNTCMSCSKNVSLVYSLHLYTVSNTVYNDNTDVLL